MKVAHFNIDHEIKKYLKGSLYTFSLTPENLNRISDKEKIEIISVKSQSTINENVVELFPRLKLIITRTVGVDHIDLKACKEKKIIVKNILDYGASNVAEHALALLMAGARNIIQADEEVHQGKFLYKNFLGKALKGKTLGVIGTGKIGLELIKIVKGFDLRVLGYDIVKNEKAAKELNFSYVSLEKLLKNSDFISIHVPLFKSTFHLIGENEIVLMKKEMILVNTSRGEIVDTKALIKQIKKFKAVCLDVVEDEKNFTKSNLLLKYKNIIITPHIGFYTDDSIKEIARQTQNYIEEFINK